MTTEGPTDSRLTSVLFTDNNGWLMISNATGSKLRLDNLAWSEVSFGDKIMNKDRGLAAATDPTTGSMYIINGGVDNGVKKTFTYNEVINQYKEIGQTVPMESEFAGAWTNARKTMLIHGGIRANVVQDLMFEFIPSNDVPVIQPVLYSGDAPTARQGHCMVSAYGGTKMIVFGGIGASNTALGDIYILDTSNLKWSRGTDGGVSVARAYTACAISNDMFVAWGGCDGAKTTVTSNVTVVYNLKTNQWVSSYSPFPYVGPTGSGAATPSGTGPENESNPAATNIGAGSDGNSNSGGIIGGVVGGLAVISILVGLFIFHRRRQANQANTSTAISEPVTAGKDKAYHYSNSPHTDPDAPPTSDTTRSEVAPQYHIFQPSVSESGYVHHLAIIDHHQQNQLPVQQQQPSQQQEQKEQEQLPLKAPQTFNIDSPVTSFYTPSSNSSAGANASPVMTSMMNSRNSVHLYQPTTRNPHTPSDEKAFASFPSPERHPHTFQI
ncbi:hypothetical protein EC991_009472 [Linnemannia zychae]|nr:hypothetical protein EC991_009472 [Linnemannia zychae]